MNLLQAYDLIHSFDIICLSETFSDLTIRLDHPDLLMNNYTLFCDDHTQIISQKEFAFITKLSASTSFQHFMVKQVLKVVSAIFIISQMIAIQKL